MRSTRFLSGVALASLALSFTGTAYAQSTASQIEDEEIVVTGRTRTIEGAMTAEQAARARSTITEEFISTQVPGQTILQSVNLLPGVNFSNNDAYGASGGSVNLRGFDGNRVSLTFDGIQLNDSGNYAIFSSQLLDPEMITRANVNLGTSEVDSPTASAVGGTINFVTRNPDEDLGGIVSASVGDDGFYRLFGEFDTGAFGPGTMAYVAGSYQQNELFAGPGEIQRTQVNARVYQPLNGDDFISASFFYNSGRNHFYRRFNMVQFNAGAEATNIDRCVFDTTEVANRTNDNEGSAGNNNDPASCTNYYNLRINPVDVANLRAQSRFSLGEHFTLTVDPSFQYVMANGGGTTVVEESDQRLRGASGQPGVDLNGDGDVADAVRLYSPSNTNTRRWGLFTGLLWDINENHRLRVNYTFDQAHHRQTGEYGLLNAAGDPTSVWGGKDGWGSDPILTADGDVFQKRDRFSIAELRQWSAEYRGDFLDEMFTVTLGLRAPEFIRELNQHCYAQTGSTNNPICTAGPQPAGTLAPFSDEVSYDDLLPNVGLTYRPMDNHMFFLSYAQGLSAPRTDDLYNGLTPAQIRVVQPETSDAYDLGYRYQGDSMLVSATVWANQYHDRIERVTIDPGPPEIRASANVGDVDLWGADLELGWRVTDAFTLYSSVSYVQSEIQDDLVFNNNGTITFALTGGKSLPDRPEWTVAARGEYDFGNGFTVGLQGKFTDERWADLVNSQSVDAYTTFDLDLRWDVGEAWRNEHTYLQLNVVNLTDERYIGLISTQVNNPGTIYQLGAPRTVSLMLRTEF